MVRNNQNMQLFVLLVAASGCLLALGEGLRGSRGKHGGKHVDPWADDNPVAGTGAVAGVGAGAVKAGAGDGYSGCAGAYEQCGGDNWRGAGCCDRGLHCEWGSKWYSQCKPQKGYYHQKGHGSKGGKKGYNPKAGYGGKGWKYGDYDGGRP